MTGRKKVIAQEIHLPIWVECTVVHGFKRGSKQLGFPTANVDEKTTAQVPESIEGVYYGWASINDGPVYPMSMSAGYNPHFGNKVRTLEVHILHVFEDDFYDQKMSIYILGFVREMTPFTSLDALIAAINNDIKISKEQLALPHHKAFQTPHAFQHFRGKSVVANCELPSNCGTCPSALSADGSATSP